MSWPGKECAGWSWGCHLLHAADGCSLVSKLIPLFCQLTGASYNYSCPGRLMLFSGMWWWAWKLAAAQCFSEVDWAIYSPLSNCTSSWWFSLIQSGSKMPPDQNSNDFHLLCAAINDCAGNLGWKAAGCCRGDRASVIFALLSCTCVPLQKLCWAVDEYLIFLILHLYEVLSYPTAKEWARAFTSRSSQHGIWKALKQGVVATSLLFQLHSWNREWNRA